ncbi:MAG: hypothetical protein AB8E82_09550 [Aureispira sp.]
MRQTFLFLSLLILPFLSKGQDAATLQYMKAMGYEQVDLNAKRQEQTATPCKTCPAQAPKAVPSTPMTASEELQNLKAHLPKLKQLVADSQSNPSISAAMRQKHQTALDRSLTRIKELEQTSSPTSIAK